MHELSVAESILNISCDYAARSGASRVTAIDLVIGQLSSIVDDSVMFYWDFVAENSICEGAQLRFTRTPARLQCLDCELEYTIPDQLSPCPRCSSFHVRIVAGEEFYVDSIEIEKEELKTP
jgi:hydrogenase nickel incorporation protein HypA/HybF